MPATFRACSAARLPSRAVESPLPATRRSLIPVRSVIHWSLVSTSSSRSALVRTYGGTATPSPTISAGTTAPFSGVGGRRLGRSEGPEAEQDLAGRDQLALPGEMSHDPAAEGAADGNAGGAVADLAEEVARLDVRALVVVARRADRVEAAVTGRDREPLGQHHHFALVLALGHVGLGRVAGVAVGLGAQRVGHRGHTLGVPGRQDP